MKTWEKILLYPIGLCLWLEDHAKKTGKFIERKSKPAIAMLVAVTMLLSLMPMTAFAALITNQKNSIKITPYENIGENDAHVAESLAQYFLGDPTALVENSASIVCADNHQIATLTGGTELLGIEEGFVLSTGNTHANFDNSYMADYNGTYKDADLNELIESQGQEYGGDTAALQFQVRSTGTALDFNYVFVSSEFDQNSKYNDIFGLFIKVNDGEFENIALLPEGEMVTITNLRTDPLTNSTGARITKDMQLRYITTDINKVNSAYNGYSIVLTASKNVAVGDVITVKFVIADVGDHNYDSSIIMQKGSFKFTAKGNSITSLTEGTELELNRPAENGAADFSVKVDGIALPNNLYSVENADTKKPVIKFTEGANLNCQSVIEIGIVGITEPIVITNNLAHQWSTQYENDADGHWKKCTVNGCDETSEKTEHGYTYTASDNIITESCICGHEETATLNAPSGDVIYDGAEKIAIVFYSENWKGGNLTVTHNNNINAGDLSASASISIKGATAEIYWTILAATPLYDIPTDLTATYGDTLADITLPNGWSWDDSLTTSVGNVGTKIFVGVFTPTDAENYKTVKADITVTVKKADSACAEPTARLNLVYNGDAMELINAGSAVGGEMQYVLGANSTTAPANNWSTTIPTGKNAGTYYVWYRVVGDSNHNDVAPACVPVTIAKAQLTVTANNKTIIYGNAPDNNGVTYTGFVSNEIEHALGGTLEYDYSYTQYGNVGDYNITPKGLTSENYEIIFVKGILTVEQKEIGIAWSNTALTYNGTSQRPTATATGMVNGDELTLTVSGEQTNASDTAYTATVTAISGAKAGNYKLPSNVTANFTIAKADQTAPVVNKANETISKKADGKLTNVSANMEYRAEGESTYTTITGNTVEDLAAGKYYVRMRGDGNHNPSLDTAVTIAAGRKLNVTLLQNQVGYTLTVDKSTLDWREEFTLTYSLKDGYTELSNFAVEVNGSSVTLTDGKYTVTDSEEDIVITVNGVADITVPVAEINIKDNKWTSFWNSITFGLFFNEIQDVTITANDLGSGVNTIQYYLTSGELSEDEVEVITDWQDYNGTFKINPDNKYVVYAKITDNAGNSLIINSNGIVLDATAPVINGIENGQNYYGQVVFTVTDALTDIDRVEIDGVDKTHFESQYVINPDNQEHTVIATDKAGNAIEYKIMVYENYTVTFKVDGNTVDTQTVGYGKDATAPAIPEKEGYTQTAPTWDKDGTNITADIEINAVYTINEYTITFMDESGVYKILTVKHGEKVTISDVPTKDGYTVKWDKELDTVKEDVTVKAVYTEIPKTDSPQTGDNSNMALWIALLFISGGAVITLTVVDRKKRTVKR